ncbi:MAG: conjugal transfer protein TraF [Endomicrobia bacterium]|nr:conjugal transfer protein TraF [Endomicrobiia bacterium]
MRIYKDGFYIILLVNILFQVSYTVVMFDQDFGARAGGLGGSFTSIADNVDAIIWNPAGLSKLDTQEVSFMYSKPFVAFSDVDLSYQYIGYGRYISKLRGGIGIAWTNFTNSDVYKQEIIAVGISRVLNPTKQFSAGLTLKYLGHKYNFNYLPANDPAKAYGDNKYSLGVDVGVLYNFRPNIRVGLCVRNINSPDIGIMSSDVVPMEIRVGINTILLSKLKFEEIIPLVEVISRHDKTTLSFGVEGYLMKKSIVLRIGSNDYETALGFGWYKRLKNFTLKIDYAYSIPTQIESSGGSHKISMSFKM